MISEIDQQSLDIDWFFTNGNEIGFVASGGGKLPDSIVKSYELYEILKAYLRDLPCTTDIVINPALGAIKNNVTDRYLADFVDMSKKGFYSFDKTHLNNFSDPNYHLVASPVNPFKFDELPLEMQSILLSTKCSGNIGETLNIDMIQ